MKDNLQNIIKVLKKGGIGVMPTDTLYGLVGSAFSKNAIERIYKIKKRNKKKKLIVLISAMAEIEKFGIKITSVQYQMLHSTWPGKVSVIINNIAFRLPAKKSLIEILKKTGPLVAPSANPEGLMPAENITQAKKYFGSNVDFYLSGGTLKGEPSKIIKIDKKGNIKTFR